MKPQNRNITRFILSYCGLFFLAIFPFYCHGAQLGMQLSEAVQEKDENYFDYEDYDKDSTGKIVPIGKIVFLKGCSWYCGGYVNKVSASSERSNGNTIHKAEYAHDFDKDTSWVPGNGEHGIGERLIYEFNFDDMYERYGDDSKHEYNGRLGVTTIILANGNKTTKKLWKEYSRVKKFRLHVNDSPYLDIALLDSYEIQKADIGKIIFPKNETTKLTFEILEIYPGDKHKEPAISELVFGGVGVH